MLNEQSSWRRRAVLLIVLKLWLVSSGYYGLKHAEVKSITSLLVSTAFKVSPCETSAEAIPRSQERSTTIGGLPRTLDPYPIHHDVTSSNHTTCRCRYQNLHCQTDASFVRRISDRSALLLLFPSETFPNFAVVAAAKAANAHDFIEVGRDC